MISVPLNHLQILQVIHIEKKEHYCGILKICGGSIFMGFKGSPIPRIYILHENKVWKG